METLTQILAAIALVPIGIVYALGWIFAIGFGIAFGWAVLKVVHRIIGGIIWEIENRFLR